METKMIIGIDHGNRNMKTANTVFSAAIQPLQARPDSLEHILEYQNQFYYVGGKSAGKRSAWIRQRMKIIIFLPLQHWRRKCAAGA